MKSHWGFRGGGNVINNDLDRRHHSFLWMSHEAVWAGLRLNRPTVEWKWDELGSLRESLTLAWKPLEYFPLKRLSYESAAGFTRWYVHHFDKHVDPLIFQPFRPHRGMGRKVQPGQKVHISVAFCDKTYLPKAIHPDGVNWAKLVGLGGREDLEDLPWRIQDEPLFELDIFDNHDAEHVIKIIENASDNVGGLQRLVLIANTSYEDESPYVL